MSFQKIIGCVFVLQFLMLTACDPEPPAKENFGEKIIGHWEVFEALRNEKVTTTLEDAYFDFEGEGNAILNLTGAEQKASYTLTENVINISGTQMDGDFTIEKVSGDTLVLTTKQTFNEIPFRFIFSLKKAEKTSEEEKGI